MAAVETAGSQDVAGPPPGRAWHPLGRGGPFTQLTGPYLYTRDDLEEAEPVRFGVLVREEHCNPRMVCHGGMLATFIDVALAGALLTRPDLVSPVITISLTLDYLAAAHRGEWIESRITIPRLTYRTGYAQAMLYGPEGPVLRGSGVFKLARAKPQGDG